MHGIATLAISHIKQPLMKRSFISMPNLERFQNMVESIFESGILTNNGAMARELEARFSEYFDTEFVVLTSSGSLALQIAYYALDLKGEVITTPFSWITTASSLQWVGLQPKFVDIQPDTFNIDPQKIEAGISPQTSAILAVHSFGNPSDIDAIEEIASRNRLKTLYDGAHAFGTTYKGKSIFTFGDAAILSLHATKIFHSIEGGVVFLRDKTSYENALVVANNGLDEHGNVTGLGINGRMSELHAAAGLCLLDNIHDLLSMRKHFSHELQKQLKKTCAVELQSLNKNADVNHAYFAILAPSFEQREQVISGLNSAGYWSFRYCSQTLNHFTFLNPQPSLYMPMPVAESVSDLVICLMLPANTTLQDIMAIADIITSICPIKKPITRKIS